VAAGGTEEVCAICFQALDLYWRSPGSGGLWYKSKQLRKTIWRTVAAIGAEEVCAKTKGCEECQPGRVLLHLRVEVQSVGVMFVVWGLGFRG